MDPITLMATITATFNGVKKAVAVGREAHDILKQLGRWAEGADQMYSWLVKQENKKPGLFETVNFEKSETREALDMAAARLQLKNMEDEIKNMFYYGQLQELGQAGYRDFILARKEIREKRQKMIREQIKRRTEFVEMCFWIVIAIIVIGTVGFISYAFLSWALSNGRF